MKIPLVPTLSTFTYLRFQFEQEEYLTPEERLRRHFQASLGEQITSYQKKAYDKVQVVSSTAAIGTRMHELVTADFAALEHRATSSHLDLCIVEDKRPPRTLRQMLDAMVVAQGNILPEDILWEQTTRALRRGL